MRKIELLVRAIIKEKEKILLCKKKTKQYYFFPGGHVEFGESAEKALKRELKEELGIKIKKLSLVGGTEHVFTEDKRKRHEINLIFYVLVEKLNIKSKEDHLRFHLLGKNEFKKANVLPKSLKKTILQWEKDKKIFWVCEI